MKPQKITALTEAIFGDKPTIDTEAGVIRGVKILGRVSKNGREYSDGALAEAARQYEGAKVNLNHPGKKDGNSERPFEAGIAWLENVSIRPEGVYGDMPYLKSHPQSGVLVEAAQRNPSRFGLSHNAEGSMVKKNGKNVVESISRVHSVDIVQNPATNQGLFESCDPEPLDTEKPVKTQVKLKEFVAAIDAKAALKSKLVKLFEMDEMAAMGDYPTDSAPAEMSADDQAIEAIVALVRAALKEGDPDKAGMAIKALGKIIAPEAPAPAPEAPSGDAAAEAAAESVKVEKAKTDAATELLEAAGIKVDQSKVKALVALHGQTSDRKALVESWRPAAATPAKPAKPAFLRPITEGVGEFPADNKSFLSAIGAKAVKV
ncbi:MAG: hypothetical protein ACXU95_04845 [Isosphaeraceae bacterium]